MANKNSFYYLRSLFYGLRPYYNANNRLKTWEREFSTTRKTSLSKYHYYDENIKKEKMCLQIT